MSETNFFMTSLAKSETPNIDRLFSNGEAGFYSPVIKDGFDAPKTDIVIPYMYFIDPDAFLGRGILELVDSNYPLKEGDWVASFRIYADDKSNNKREDVLTELEASKLLSIMQFPNLGNVLLSPFSSHKNIFLMVDRERENIEKALNKVPELMKNYGKKVSQVMFYQYKKPISPLKEQLYFLGWSYGSLRGAFRLIGSGVNEFIPERYQYQEYQKDFFSIQQSNLINLIERYDALVMFIKETDSASHLGRQDLKIRAIETLDWLVGQLLPFVPSDSRIVILTDHPTDLGSPNAINAPAPYLIVDARKNSLSTAKKVHFCEETLAQLSKGREPLLMRDLRDKIYGLNEK